MANESIVPNADPNNVPGTASAQVPGAGAPPSSPTGSGPAGEPGAGSHDPAPTGASAEGAPASDPAPDAAQMVPRARIDREVREKWEARRRADAAEQEVMRLRAGVNASVPPVAPDGFTAPDPANLDQLVQQRAEQLARVQDFDRRCNDVYARGKRDIPDFEQAIANFGMFGGLGQHPDFVDAVTQLEDSPKVLHYLGTHPDEAERVMSLRGAAQGLALGQLSARIGTVSKSAPAPTRTPAPVAPVRGTAAPQAVPNDRGEFTDQDTYRQWREKNFRRR